MTVLGVKVRTLEVWMEESVNAMFKSIILVQTRSVKVATTLVWLVQGVSKINVKAAMKWTISEITQVIHVHVIVQNMTNQITGFVKVFTYYFIFIYLY